MYLHSRIITRLGNNSISKRYVFHFRRVSCSNYELWNNVTSYCFPRSFSKVLQKDTSSQTVPDCTYLSRVDPTFWSIAYWNIVVYNLVSRKLSFIPIIPHLFGPTGKQWEKQCHCSSLTDVVNFGSKHLEHFCPSFHNWFDNKNKFECVGVFLYLVWTLIYACMCNANATDFWIGKLWYLMCTFTSV